MLEPQNLAFRLRGVTIVTKLRFSYSIKKNIENEMKKWWILRLKTYKNRSKIEVEKRREKKSEKTRFGNLS